MPEPALILGGVTLAVVAAAVWLLVERFRLTAERDLARGRLADLERDTERTRESFQALAADALHQNSRQFLELAGQRLDDRRQAVDSLVQPIGEALKSTGEKLEQLSREKDRSEARLKEQLELQRHLAENLREETGKLVQALRRPNVRGRYGEIQLQRVVELAGMRSWCDFSTQATVEDDAGQRWMPDLLVRLPNGRSIAVDAKLSIDAYLDALETPDEEEAERLLTQYAKAVAEQVKKLGRKAYWEKLDHSPELVVMFVPGDQLVDAALQRRPDLVEQAAELDVVLASPSTLIGLLRAVHVGWREKRLGDDAQELFELGGRLLERAATALSHVGDLGKSLRQSVEQYNKVVGSMEKRLVPTLRQFEERGAKGAKKLEPLKEIEPVPREPVDLQLDLPMDEDEPAPGPEPLPRSRNAG